MSASTATTPGPTNSPCSATTLTCLLDGPLKQGCALVFDLDDTLYEEEDFVASGFSAVAKACCSSDPSAVFDRLQHMRRAGSIDPFGKLLAERRLAVDKQEMLRIYREHEPTLSLGQGLSALLMGLRAAGRKLGLLTDGRSLTQRNKLVALGVDKVFHEVVISEEFGSCKPAEANYRHFMDAFNGVPCAYIGDNLKKDFVTANRLGWTTVGVQDRGRNIHPQDPNNHPASHWPDYWVERIA